MERGLTDKSEEGEKMRLTMNQLKKLIKEEANRFVAKSRINEGLITESPWIGSNDELTDTCPGCGGDENEHKSSGCTYNQCSFCGHSHTFEPDEARAFHAENDPDDIQSTRFHGF